MESRENRVEPKDVRKPYAPPKLVRLGSVRELTFGTSIQPKPDGTFTRASDK
jgi:hypothetical protein